jgi:hypothetical protein
MARYRGTTAERGLGSAHVKDKERLLAAHVDGTPCRRCGQPMYKAQALDRGHVVDRAKGGTDGPAMLEHASCNRSAGSTAGNQSHPRFILAAGRDTVCKACRKPYHYAARSCEICGAHYHPNHAAQRSCGRTCGAELQRRNKGLPPRPPSQPGPRPSPLPREAVLDLLGSPSALRAAARTWRTSRQW